MTKTGSWGRLNRHFVCRHFFAQKWSGASHHPSAITAIGHQFFGEAMGLDLVPRVCSRKGDKAIAITAITTATNNKYNKNDNCSNTGSNANNSGNDSTNASTG